MIGNRCACRLQLGAGFRGIPKQTVERWAAWESGRLAAAFGKIEVKCQGAISMSVSYGPISWERMIRAVEKVRERLMRATTALEAAGIPYAVAGGNAVAAWVSRVDEAAVRNTQDVDILIRREDLDRVKEALAAVGFVYRHAKSVDMFLDLPNANARDAVHIIFAQEKVRKEYPAATPSVDESQTNTGYRVLTLDALAKMMLTSFSTEDAMLVRDLIEVGLVDATWLGCLPAELAARLKELLDNPEE
jgi:hypothetical protein